MCRLFERVLMEDLFPREYWKEATQPTRLHTPENSAPYQLKRVGTDRRFGKKARGSPVRLV